MARRTPKAPRVARPQARPVATDLLDPSGDTILDLLDHLLNKGVMLNGDVTLGVAGIDLIYLRLSSIFCAADRILPPGRRAGRRRTARPPVARRSRR
ncbi:MAG: gas vesicle protein [Acidobacteriota bacterium]